jgi:hypothetical protein
VLDPLLQFVEIGAGSLEISIRGDEDQLVVVIHRTIVT